MNPEDQKPEGTPRRVVLQCITTGWKGAHVTRTPVSVHPTGPHTDEYTRGLIVERDDGTTTRVGECLTLALKSFCGCLELDTFIHVCVPP